MKKLLIISVWAVALPLTVSAQDDDLYFTAKKKTESAEALQKQQATCNTGKMRDVDEFNRHGKSWSLYQKVGEDGRGNDIIQFQKGNGIYPDSSYIDTTFVGKYYDTILNEDDYAYTRHMSRWDDYYGWYNLWFYDSFSYGPYWRSYWGWYDSWYSPYYSAYWGWYNPWYYSGWGYPYYYGSPYYYGYNYYRGYPYAFRSTGRYTGSRSYGFPSHATASRGVAGVRSYSMSNRAGHTASPRSFSNRSESNRAFGNRTYSVPRVSNSVLSRSVGSFSGGGSFGGGNFGGGGHFGRR